MADFTDDEIQKMMESR